LRFWRFFDSERKPFVGEVGTDSFSIYRDIWYQNSFLPRIRGRVEATLSGSKVSIKMSLHPLVTAMLGCFVIMAAYSIINSYSIVRSVRPFDYIFIAFLAAIVPIGFIPEAIKAKRLLTEAIQTPEDQSIER
jgi:hypothetical protein